MDKGNTKHAILNASLDLFSVQGFEATSISQIADAVGVRKASIYSHFDNKQAILDELIKVVLEQYENHSVFSGAIKDSSIGKAPITPDSVVKMVQEQIKYLLHDSYISKARKMLVIEQFRNQELANLQTKQNYTDVMIYFTALIKSFTEQGALGDYDAKIMAAQFCLPISMWINLCDREPEREGEILELVEKHIRQFFNIYQPKE